MEKEYEIIKQREKLEKEVEEVKGIENGKRSINPAVVAFGIMAIMFNPILRESKLGKKLESILEYRRQIRWQRFVNKCQDESFAEGTLLDECNDSDYQYIFGEIAHNLYEDIYGTFEWAH